MRLGAFDFFVHDSDTSRLTVLPGVDANLDANPDFNQPGVTGSWFCTPPEPRADTAQDGPGRAASFLSCFSDGRPPGPPVAPGDSLVIASLHYVIPSQTAPGVVVLTPSNVHVTDELYLEVFSCGGPGAYTDYFQQPFCPLALVTIGGTPVAPTPVATATPTATPTPTPVSNAPCADVTGDGRVRMTDVLLITLHTRRAYDARFDINGDGRVDTLDVGIAIGQLGRRCRR